MSVRGRAAKRYFEEGYNCAQAVVLVYADQTGLDEDTLLRLASSFGGGMGRLREVCGAVSGMFIVAGLLKGYSSPVNARAKKEHYALVQRLAGEFETRNGSIVCRELLGLEERKSPPDPERRTEAYYKKRPCAELVECAAEILERELGA